MGPNRTLHSPHISRNANAALADNSGCDKLSNIIGNTAVNISGRPLNHSAKQPNIESEITNDLTVIIMSDQVILKLILLMCYEVAFEDIMLVFLGRGALSDHLYYWLSLVTRTKWPPLTIV